MHRVFPHDLNLNEIILALHKSLVKVIYVLHIASYFSHEKLQYYFLYGDHAAKSNCYSKKSNLFF